MVFHLEIGYKDLEVGFLVFKTNFFLFQYEIYKEIDMVTLPAFISEMGGQFGLFAGVSIVTIVNFLLKFTLLLEHVLSHMFKRLVNCVSCK